MTSYSVLFDFLFCFGRTKYDSNTDVIFRPSIVIATWFLRMSRKCGLNDQRAPKVKICNIDVGDGMCRWQVWVVADLQTVTKITLSPTSLSPKIHVSYVFTIYEFSGKQQPVNRDRYISKMFLRGDSVIIVLKNPLEAAK